MATHLHSDDGDPGFQIAPMVDIVFVLILFFMACVSFDRREFRLRTALPAVTHPGTSEVAIKVTIASGGEVYLQDKLIADAGDREVLELVGWLRAARQNFGESDPVVIAPAPDVAHARIVDVLNAVRNADWSKVAFR
jgi:biopolymer transport protein ExbD